MNWAARGEEGAGQQRSSYSSVAHHGFKLIIVGLCCLWATLVWTDAKQSVTHTMQWGRGENIHIAADLGAINRQTDVTVNVEAFSSGRAIVIDSGKFTQQDLYRDYSSDDATEWSNVWTGKWSLAGEAMHLNLALHKRTCAHQKKWSNSAAESLPCSAVSKALHLTCTPETLRIEKQAMPVWRCSLAAKADLAFTPSQWMLGRASCVRVMAGPVGESYQACTERNSS